MLVRELLLTQLIFLNPVADYPSECQSHVSTGMQSSCLTLPPVTKAAFCRLFLLVPFPQEKKKCLLSLFLFSVLRYSITMLFILQVLVVVCRLPKSKYHQECV